MRPRVFVAMPLAGRYLERIEQHCDVEVFADTHGYVDPRLAAAFAGVEAIIHAGDVGGPHVLEALGLLAPLSAVRGNNDEKLSGLGLRLHEDFELAGVRFHLVHQLPHARASERTDVVVFGHSQRALIECREGVLYLNPGAAGPPASTGSKRSRYAPRTAVPLLTRA